MIKRNLLEVIALESSFTAFRRKSLASESLNRIGASERASGRLAAAVQGATQEQQRGASEQDAADEHTVYATDLVVALGVTEDEAEEMIFIADLKDGQGIDFTEFRQVVVNWSGCRA